MERTTVDEMERTIIRQILTHALHLNYTVILGNGDDRYSEGGHRLSELMALIHQSEREEIRFYDQFGSYVGDVTLGYGNEGYDVIMHYTDGEEIEALMRGLDETYDALDMMEVNA